VLGRSVFASLPSPTRGSAIRHSSNVCLMVVACTVVGKVAVGCSCVVGAIYSAKESFA